MFFFLPDEKNLFIVETQRPDKMLKKKGTNISMSKHKENA